MKIILLCLGSLKAGPEKDLFEQYLTRLSWPFEMKEVICRKSGAADQVKTWEGELLLQAIDPDSLVIGLDERGSSLTSPQFARIIDTYRNEGVKSLTFLIGGADGFSEAVRARCQRLISFGQMTWPHLLVRGMLAEQLYRAQQILIGHPYHRV
ncbi:MAG: 23S rRNA (pseudouridine(1915)-N(3))-methyltransferase RlmH [Alphaproteobacteria bacterium]|jgi:23S rRNA (pseudouridine1915-N3)-methyltransferase|nr:23S rRNA (pseudouridine(1915)-N(3))-methyltransferase RlmH [Alphaproteobacteria bacterium]